MRKTTRRKGFLPAALAGALCFCATTSKLTTGPALPDSAAPADSVLPVPSTINIPLELKSWYIEEQLNRQLPDPLYQCDTVTLGSFKNVGVTVWKQDSISLALENDELSYRIPLRLRLRFSFTMGALGVSHTEYQDVEAAIALSFKSRIFVKNDWKVVTMTQYGGYEWLSDPVVKVRFITIPVKPVADLILARQEKLLGTLVDNAVSSLLDIKQMLRPFWQRIQEPLLLAQEPDSIWLRLAPQSIYMTQLAGSRGTIRSSVGVRTVAETFFGARPAMSYRDSLPEFVIPGAVDSAFVINLYARLPFTSATEMLRGYLVGRSFTAGRREVIVQDVTLYAMEGFAVVSINFTGSFRGDVYVIGRIRYDEAGTAVSIEDLDFDLATKKALPAAAGWLLHDVILTKVKPYLRFPMREKLLELQLMVQRMLSHRSVSKDVYLNGMIDSLAIGGVRLTDEAIEAVLQAKGSLNIMIHD